ncbi:MAG: hypothetical protein DWQ02_22830 [Bacteroidetes bacterium]|nr:MAG: hypothetical protein DWQ02_22830 [Bacteroidota bacterium]
MELQHKLILKAAEARGILVKDVSAEMNCDAAVLSMGSKSELLVRGTPTSLISVRSQHYCDNKALTKKAFEYLEIPAPRSIVFQNPEGDAVKNFLRPGRKYVCKPPDGTNGVGVEMNISTVEDVVKYWGNHHNDSNDVFLLEDQIEGEDLRVQVVGGKIVAVCTREPAHVLGDGQSSIQDLISEYQVVVRTQNPANNLVVDQTTKRLLREQNLQLEDVLEAGQKAMLKELANMAQGAVAIDKTDAFHPDFQEWVDKLVAYLGTSYFAIDIIAPDLTAAPTENAYALEINARPEWMHHTFSRGRTHDMAGLVLGSVFH